jgi:uncharacterized membrane protein YphA (DoxX/SURF4 family)
MRTVLRIAGHVARIVVGITFIFSGLVKGIDPWGSSYKFIDYFNALGIEWLSWSAFPLGMLLAFAEFLIGVTLLFAMNVRIFSWGALIFMLFFTPLTLWIAIANPVTDCGCFGDALVISNWETFYKNVVLIILALVVFLLRKRLKPLLGPVSSILGYLSILAYGIVVGYSAWHEPVLDFRPYKVGVNIIEAMTIPEDAEHDVYENIFYYKNKQTGEVHRFTEADYPWQDTDNWEFERMDEPRLIKQGFRPAIKAFNVETRDGDNIYDFFLYDEQYVFMLVAYDITASDRRNQDKINTLATWAMEQGFSFICLTSSLFEVCDQFAAETGAPYEFFHADEIDLKTMIRSNPGLLVLKGGTIVAKYSRNQIPTVEEFRSGFLK